MKKASSINMSNTDIYKKEDLHIFQQLIRKLIYLIYNTKLNITFTIWQLNNHNANLQKSLFQAFKNIV